MDKTRAIDVARQYADAVVKEMSPSPNKIVLFGSYAKGNASETSDIDIAVIFDGFNGDWFQTCVQLSGLTWSVNAAIEPILLDSQDDRTGFVEEVMRTGELVYQREEKYNEASNHFNG